MKITLCSNTETLAPIWSIDGLTDDDHESIAGIWVNTAHDALVDAGYDVDWERSFQYWHGGPGRGYVTGPDDPAISAALETADKAAQAAAQTMRRVDCIIEARHPEKGQDWDSDYVGNEIFEREEALAQIAELQTDPQWEGWEFRLLVNQGDGNYRPE